MFSRLLFNVLAYSIMVIGGTALAMVLPVLAYALILYYVVPHL